jgi:hypothetical protein
MRSVSEGNPPATPADSLLKAEGNKDLAQRLVILILPDYLALDLHPGVEGVAGQIVVAAQVLHPITTGENMPRLVLGINNLLLLDGAVGANQEKFPVRKPLFVLCLYERPRPLEQEAEVLGVTGGHISASSPIWTQPENQGQ